MTAASRRGGCRTALALLRALTLYWFVVNPHTRKELRHWDRRADAISDPVLRGHALAKLRDERMVLEGAATFAILAAPRHRMDVIRACVTFEAIYEFTDVLGEQPVGDPLAHNRTLNRALVAAVEPMTPHEAHVRMLARCEPTYLHELIDACRSAIARLPRHLAILPTVQRLAALAAETQTLNHTGRADGHRQLAKWAASHGSGDAAWWELAAAANSPLGIYALFAAASAYGTTEQAVTAIDAAYYPWVGGLVWLLESLVDQHEDRRTGNHSYVAHYGSPQATVARLATIAGRAATQMRPLRHGSTHGLLLAGATSLYLSEAEAQKEDAADAATAIRAALGWPVWVLMVVLRVRRRLAVSSGLRLRRGLAAHA